MKGVRNYPSFHYLKAQSLQSLECDLENALYPSHESRLKHSKINGVQSLQMEVVHTWCSQVVLVVDRGHHVAFEVRSSGS